VWGADSKDKLAMLSLELGDYDADLDSYEILSGLTGADYIAFPEDGFSVGQSVVKYDESYFAADDDMDYSMDESMDGAFDGDDEWYEDGEDGEESAEGYYYTDENDVEHYVDTDGVDYVVAEDGTLTETQ
jgi:hypothetical protein